MFHPYRKDNSYLRAALFSSYKEKCAYCGRLIQQRDMHVDHIIPSNMEQCRDDEVVQRTTKNSSRVGCNTTNN